jgi:hypothetical protein
MSRAQKSCWDDEHEISVLVSNFVHNPDNEFFVNAITDEYVAKPVQNLLALKEPDSEVHAKELILSAHSHGHFGLGSTRKRLTVLGWDMKKYEKLIQEEVESCASCQQWTLQTRRYLKLRHTTPNLPFDIFCFDLLTGLPITERGMKGIFVGMCKLTGFTLLRAFAEKDSAELTWLVFNIFGDFGFPRQMVSDNEPTLVSQIIEAFREDFHVGRRELVPYNPRSNGLVESRIKVVGSLVRKLIKDEVNWDIILPLIQLMINDHVREDYDSTPFFNMFARDHDAFHIPVEIPLSGNLEADMQVWLQRLQLTLDVDRPWLRASIERRSQKMAEQFAKAHKQAPLEPIAPGTLVMLLDVNRASKNESPYVGPYSIKSFDEKTQSYLITDSLGSTFGRRVTVDMLKILPLARKPDDDQYYVENLLNHRKKNDKFEYLVKWVGFDETTWEPVENILDDNLVRQYWAKKSRIPKSK